MKGFQFVDALASFCEKHWQFLSVACALWWGYRTFFRQGDKVDVGAKGLLDEAVRADPNMAGRYLQKPNF